MKKLVLIDSDGTLRKSDGTFSDKTKQVIKELVDNNNYIVICTGRPRYHTEEIMKEVNASPIIVSNNGADIYNVNTKEEIGSYYINKDKCFSLIEYCYNNDLRLVISTGYVEYVNKELRNNNQILLDRNNYKEQLKDKNIFQCLIVEKDIKKLEKMKKDIIDNQEIEVKNGVIIDTAGYESWFTIGNSNANKGNALKTLANYLGIDIKDTIAIGNDYNDISMLKEAGFSICVENSLEEVKKESDYITLSNDEDGVASVLEKILKGEL